MATATETITATYPLSNTTADAREHFGDDVPALLDWLERKANRKPKPASGGKRTIKRNKSGGLFVRDASFQAYSEAKCKAYVASANIPWEVAYPLFSNEEFVKEIVDFVKSEGKAIVRSEAAPTFFFSHASDEADS